MQPSCKEVKLDEKRDEFKAKIYEQAGRGGCRNWQMYLASKSFYNTIRL